MDSDTQLNSDAELRQMQKKEEMRQVQEYRKAPPHFAWPSSKPGPEITPPSPGTKPSPTRKEQVIEVGYNQETGIPSTDDPRKWYPDKEKVGTPGFDELETAQEVQSDREKKK